MTPTPTPTYKHPIERSTRIDRTPQRSRFAFKTYVWQKIRMDSVSRVLWSVDVGSNWPLIGVHSLAHSDGEVKPENLRRGNLLDVLFFESKETKFRKSVVAQIKQVLNNMFSSLMWMNCTKKRVSNPVNALDSRKFKSLLSIVWSKFLF